MESGIISFCERPGAGNYSHLFLFLMFLLSVDLLT